MEQLVARRAHNPKVGGSSPPPATSSVTLHPISGHRAMCPVFVPVNRILCVKGSFNSEWEEASRGFFCTLRLKSRRLTCTAFTRKVVIVKKKSRHTARYAPPTVLGGEGFFRHLTCCEAGGQRVAPQAARKSEKYRL